VARRRQTGAVDGDPRFATATSTVEDLATIEVALDSIATGIAEVHGALGHRLTRHGNRSAIVLKGLWQLIFDGTEVEEQLLKELEFLETATGSTFTNGSNSIGGTVIGCIRHAVQAIARVPSEVTLDFGKVAVQTIQGAEPAGGHPQTRSHFTQNIKGLASLSSPGLVAVVARGR
jgi:hypothetical protein